MANLLEQFQQHSNISVANFDYITPCFKADIQDAVSQVEVVKLVAKDRDFYDDVKKSGTYARKWHDEYSDVTVEALAVDILKLRLLLGAKHRVTGYFHVQTNGFNAFDVEATIEDALRLISLSEKVGLDPSRMVIRIACTVEGLKACEQLHKRGIMTSAVAIFNLPQFAMAAKVGCKYASTHLMHYLGWDPKKYQPDYELCFIAQDYYNKIGASTEVMAEGQLDREPNGYMTLGGLKNVCVETWVCAELEKWPREECDINGLPYFKQFAHARYTGSGEITFKNWGDYQFKELMTHETKVSWTAYQLRWFREAQEELESIMAPLCVKSKTKKSKTKKSKPTSMDESMDLEY